MDKKALRAYRRPHFGFIGREAEEGDRYFNDERRGFLGLRKKVVIYRLIGDYWIEQEPV